MWSKQADMSNKNVTSSFKNKITNRKQRVSKSSAANNGVAPVPTEPNNKLNICADNTEANAEKTKQKSKKNRKSSSCKTLQEDPNKNSSKSKVKVAQNNNKNKSETKSVSKCTESVVLRNVAPSGDLSSKNVKDDVNKRFSDSFIVENGRDAKKPCDTVDGAIPHCDKTRKNRRFSDLFKTSSAFSGSVEDFKLLPDKVLLRQNSELNLKRTDKNEMAKSTDGKNCPKEAQNSYLKRVKSKIYKSAKSETPTSDKKTKSKKCKDTDIPEECELELRKSSSNFDFRLLRQTSNLEGIWPLRRHCEQVDSAKEMDSLFVKPTLEKAKSSSAINLNLLRTRRNKIMEQVKKRNCQEAKNEFEFVGFGNAIHDSLLFSKRLSSSQTHVGDTSRRLPPSWIHETIGESKPSQPVSRSGSDRRPDSVREESGAGKNHDGTTGALSDSLQDKNDDSPNESSVSLPSSGNKKRNTTNINRSESVKEQSEKQRKQRRNISDPSQNTSNSRDIEQNALSNATDSGSSSNSNSSISFNGRLSESPSNPNGSLRGNRSDGDSDMDADSDHINWQDLISTEQLNNLPSHEKKRQDVINELFYTEKSHMRSLNVLHKIFYKPLQKSQVLKPDELSLIFPNIRELLQIHRQFNYEMTQKRREDPIVRNLGDLLLNMFSGTTGEAFKEAAAKFCERQQLALELIKERRKRDSKFESILSEGEKKRQCRRLQFQAILPVEMQRLSKLPLLLERLIGAVQEGNGNEEELNKLNRAYQLSKEIVNHVNEAAKMALNQARLEEIQRHLDQSNFERSNDPISQEFRPLDLTKYKLVREGPMHLRRPNKSSVLVHVLLMEEVVVILHKESDKYVLKNFHTGASGQTNPLSPIIKMSTLLVRINAVCKNALFLVNTSTNNSQMYDLRAEDDAKRDVWFKHFSDVTDAYNKKEGKTRRNESTPDNDDEESVEEFPQPQDVSERAEEIDHVENEEPFRTPAVDATGGPELESEATSEEQENRPEKDIGEGDVNTGVPCTVTAEEWPLIQPSQVHVAVLPVHIAESRLTPIEQIRRKNEEVRRNMKEREDLIADLLGIPQQEFHTIADMVSEEDSTTDGINPTVASIYQTERLQKIILDTMNLSNESDIIQATGGNTVSCASQKMTKSNPPSIPTSQIQDVVDRLNKHLTEVLDKQKQLEDENSLLRNELYKMRERFHEQLAIHDTSGSSSTLPDTSTLENEEEVEINSERAES